MQVLGCNETVFYLRISCLCSLPGVAFHLAPATSEKRQSAIASLLILDCKVSRFLFFHVILVLKLDRSFMFV